MKALFAVSAITWYQAGMAKDMNPLEKAARTLCTMDGHPENAVMDGKPLWQEYLPAARAALSSAQMNWRPISTAPQDGSPVLLYIRGEPNPRREMLVGAWDAQNSRWTVTAAVYRIVPTHWLPLPPPPAA